MQGKTQVLASGIGLMDTYQTRKANIMEYKKSTVAIEVLDAGSGVTYYVRGHPVAGQPAYLTISSGDITVSGGYTFITSGMDSHVYEEVVVAAKATSAGESGLVTILIANKVK